MKSTVAELSTSKTGLIAEIVQVITHSEVIKENEIVDLNVLLTIFGYKCIPRLQC